MSLQHIQKNSPGLLPKPAKFEKNPLNGYRVIRKTKCGAGGAAGAGGAGGAGSSPIHKQASLAGRLIKMATSFGEGKIFFKLPRIQCSDTLWVENFDEIALSRTVEEI